MQNPYELDLKIPTISDSLPTMICDIKTLNIDKTDCQTNVDLNCKYMNKANKSIYTNYLKLFAGQKRRKVLDIDIVSKKRKFEEI